MHLRGVNVIKQTNLTFMLTQKQPVYVPLLRHNNSMRYEDFGGLWSDLSDGRVRFT